MQPDDNAADRDAILKLIGKNAYGNDWNHTRVQAGLNAWIGKLDDGTVAAVQTMLWDYRPWGCACGIAGPMGNLYAERGLRVDNLQNSFEKKLDISNESCTSPAKKCQEVK